MVEKIKNKMLKKINKYETKANKRVTKRTEQLVIDKCYLNFIENMKSCACKFFKEIETSLNNDAVKIVTKTNKKGEKIDE